jgi:hypothetical protein
VVPGHTLGPTIISALCAIQPRERRRSAHGHLRSRIWGTRAGHYICLWLRNAATPRNRLFQCHQKACQETTALGQAFNDEMLLERMRAVSPRAEPIERGYAHSAREVSI